jgi:UDP-glucose 4-epimerase
MSKILITGGAGFIGSHLAETFSASGHDVLCVDNLVTGNKKNLKPRIKLFEMDICAHEFHAAYGEFKPDICIHAAASYKDPTDHWSDARTNVLGCVQVARLAKEHATKRVIYFQTALCYGLNPASPVAVDHELDPWDTSYSMSKTTGEQYLRLSGVPLTVFRLAHICGPRNISGPIPTFYKRILEGKDCKITDSRRDFVFIGDLVRLVENVVSDPSGFCDGVFHVSSGRDYPILAIYDLVATAMKKRGASEFIPGGPDDAKTILLNSSQTNSRFGWEPKTSLKDAIMYAVAWYGTQELGETYTHLKGAK